MNKPYIFAGIALIAFGVALGLYVWNPDLSFGQAGNEERNPTPTSADNAPPGSIHNLPVLAAVEAVKEMVAQLAKVNEGEVIVMSAYEKEWSDSCLGLGGPAESCLFVITPGYEVTAQAKGKTYVYRTNADGSVLRADQSSN